jgi:hypothetical protein
LSPNQKQRKLWETLVKLMKENNRMSDEIRETITYLHVQRKWNSLLGQFKALFYSSLKPSADTSNLFKFPHYNQMFKLFTDYAVRKLSINDGDETMNETTDADITAYVMRLLSTTAGSESDASEIHEKENVSQAPKVSRASKIVDKINEMPKSSVNFYQTTMRIDPNTPFKRNYGLSTIINQRNANNIAMKRENSGSEFWPHKVKIQKVSTNAKEEALDKSYEVEALDECSFFNGLNMKKSQHFKQSAGSFPQTSIKSFNLSEVSSDAVYVSNEASDFTIMELSDDSQSIALNQQLPVIKKINTSRCIETKQNLNNNVLLKQSVRIVKVPQNITFKKLQPTMTDMKNKSMELTLINNPSPKVLAPIPSPNNSILDVPQLDDSIDELRATNQSPSRFIVPVSTHRNSNNFRRSSLSLVPKKLSYEGISVPQDSQAPPEWFTTFMKRYDADQKRVDAKMEKIERMMSQLLETQSVKPQKVLLSPRISQIKRGY